MKLNTASLRIQWIGLLLIASPILGCNHASPIENALSDYHARLSRVLATPLPQPQPAPSLVYPISLDHKRQQTAVNINFRDFYAIQDCELGRLVAERNTALGKTQLPSQRFVYEHQVLSALRQCEQMLSTTNPNVANTVAQWRAVKQTQYELAWARVIQSSQEMRQGLGFSKGLLQAEYNPDAIAAIHALTFLDALSSPSMSLNSQNLEAELKIMASSRLPARLWHTQQVLTTHLSTLTTALTPALQNINCEQGIPSEKATILRNVFYIFFIQHIQPLGSQLNHYHYQLAPLWEKWLTTDVLSADFKRYIHTHAVTNFSHYQQSLHEHVTLWQQFLGRCNLSPKAPS